MSLLFFFNFTRTSELYTLSLHDALPIWRLLTPGPSRRATQLRRSQTQRDVTRAGRLVEFRSEEHTSELQSHSELVCRLLLEKKKHSAPSGNAHGPARARALRGLLRARRQ